MNDCELQAKIMESHLLMIVEHCLELQSELVSIILYGGFGRDEGSWFKDEQDNWRPYNDYDICIVADKKATEAAVRALEKNLAQKIGINWIDLSQLSPNEMKQLRPSIKNYDFKNASKVIYGDPSILDIIPEIDASTLPMKEALILYFTRLYTLIGSFDEGGIGGRLAGDGSRFFRNQMAKAILAIVDVLLLAKGAYVASYRRRVERVVELYPGEEEFIELSHWALSEKLRPKSPVMKDEEVRELYEVVHKYYLTEMYKGLSAHFVKDVKEPKDIEFCMKWLPIALVKRLYWFLKYRGLRMERQLNVTLAQSYLAAAWSRDGINEKFLSRGIELLQCADAHIPRQITWDKARLEAIRLRMEG